MSKAAQIFFNASKIMKDREYILKMSLISACEVLKNDNNFTIEQLEKFSDSYIEKVCDKLMPGKK